MATCNGNNYTHYNVKISPVTFLTSFVSNFFLLLGTQVCPDIICLSLIKGCDIEFGVFASTLTILVVFPQSFGADVSIIL
jgi:hypothetical protein